jgi:CheY-like chemotaxis protein
MAPEVEPQTTPARILVVEDEVLIRALISEELREAGFSVVEASGADEALAFFAGGEHVDLVFTDVRMPGSLTGLDLARTLHALFPALLIVITSGNHGPQDAKGLGVFVPKPYNLREVVQLLADAISGESPSKAE